MLAGLLPWLWPLGTRPFVPALKVMFAKTSARVARWCVSTSMDDVRSCSGATESALARDGSLVMGLGSRAARSCQRGLLLENEIGRRKGGSHDQADREGEVSRRAKLQLRSMRSVDGRGTRGYLAGVGRTSK